MADKTMKVQITVDATQGDPSTKTVEVPRSGASLGEVLKKAGISAKNKDLFVGGKPATLETHVGPDAKVEAKVRVQERPQGS